MYDSALASTLRCCCTPMRKVDVADIEATMYGPYCQPLVMMESTLAVALRSKVGSVITLDSLA